MRDILFTTGLVIGCGLLVACLAVSQAEAKDFRKEHPSKGHLCIARFESTTGEPMYYNCPRPNESEKKSYCCFLDKCCDYKEYQKQTEQQFKMSQGTNYGVIAKGAFSHALKALMWIVFTVILLIIGCCCLTVFLCRKKKLFSGGILNVPLPSQPPGPSPYAPPTNPYTAYQWPPETIPQGPQIPGGGARAPAPPAYPNPSYPPMPGAGVNGIGIQPPFNPNFK